MFIIRALGSILRVVFYFVLFTLIWRAISAWIRHIGQSQARAGYRPDGQATPDGRRAEITGKTVRDPVCGTYVAVELAISGPRETAPVYFCSEECKRNYHPAKV